MRLRAVSEIRGLFFAKARGDGASAKQGRVSKRLKRSKERRRRPDSDNDGDGKIGRDKKANEFNHLPHAESLFGDGALVAGHERNVVACRRSGSDDKGGPGRRRGAARSRGDADGICSRGDFSTSSSQSGPPPRGRSAAAAVEKPHAEARRARHERRPVLAFGTRERDNWERER